MNHCSWHPIVFIAILTFLLISSKANTQDETIITLNPNTTYQTITGWEATAWIGQENPNVENWQDDILNKTVELGINRIRLEVRSGVENSEDYWSQHQTGEIPYEEWRARRYSTINDNDDPNSINWEGFHFSELDNTIEKVVLPLKEKLKAENKDLFINVNYVAFTSQIGNNLNYLHDHADEYAEYVLATYLHMQKKYNLVPDTWEILLEPDNVSQWDGRLIGEAMVAVTERLQEHDFTPHFVAPSNTNMANAITYFDDMVQIPGALDYLEEFSYHRYGGVSDSNLRAIAQRAAQYDVNTAHLEWIGATYNELHKDLKIANNSSWAQFAIGGPSDADRGGLYFIVDNADSANPVVRQGSRTKFFEPYFQTIHPGATRIGANTNNPRIDPLAFINESDEYVVVVKLSRGTEFTIDGLPQGTYGMFYVTGEGRVDLPDVIVNEDEALSTSVPAAGVAAIYGKNDEAELIDYENYE